jgi:hypothetical protein
MYRVGYWFGVIEVRKLASDQPSFKLDSEGKPVLVGNGGNWEVIAETSFGTKYKSNDAFVKSIKVDYGFFETLARDVRGWSKFLCFGLDVIVDERDGKYVVLKLNHMGDYGKMKSMHEPMYEYFGKVTGKKW